MKNALTVDVEGWAQAYIDWKYEPTDEVVRNTTTVLELFDRLEVPGTFFVLGQVVEKYPGLVAEIARRGHEVGVHGWNHAPLWDLTPEEFKRGLERTIDAMAKIGIRPVGYRAPQFSIVRGTWWAFRILAELGFEYDSSVYPAHAPGRPYGVPDVPLEPHCVDPGIVEFPLTTLRLGKYRIPVAGGGYLRYLPASIHVRAVHAQLRAGRPAVIYVHPHEFDPRIVDTSPEPVSLKKRLGYAVGRRSQAKKVSRLVREFSFTTMHESLAECLSWNE